jgi:DNA-binding transcriptional LysR family regulator
MDNKGQVSSVCERKAEMDWSDLEIILAVSRAGGASAAAEALGIGHATVSRRISDVEKKLGVTLVDRSGLGWRVTPLCVAMAAQAKEMEAHHAEALRLAHAFSSELRGQVKISVPTGAVASFCGRALRRLPQDAPEIGVCFITEDKLADLPGRSADLAVRFTDAPEPDLIGECVAISQWGLFASIDIAAQVNTARSNGTLPHVPLLSSSPDGSFPDWATGLFHPDSTCHYVFGFMEKAELAENGFGVALLPMVVGKRNPALTHLSGIKIPQANELWVLANTDTRSSQRISLVKKHLIEGLKDMVDHFSPEADVR